MSSLRFGDFNGDALTDVFRTANGTWKVVYGVWQPWTDLGPAQMPADIYALVVADFDGDGRADVGADQSFGFGMLQWRMSSSGTEPPVTFNFADQPMGSSAIGRFDDRNGDDVVWWRDDVLFWLNSPFANERWSRQNMR